MRHSFHSWQLCNLYLSLNIPLCVDCCPLLCIFWFPVHSGTSVSIVISVTLAILLNMNLHSHFFLNYHLTIIIYLLLPRNIIRWEEPVFSPGCLLLTCRSHCLKIEGYSTWSPLLRADILQDFFCHYQFILCDDLWSQFYLTILSW